MLLKYAHESLYSHYMLEGIEMKPLVELLGKCERGATSVNEQFQVSKYSKMHRNPNEPRLQSESSDIDTGTYRLLTLDYRLVHRLTFG
jgi:hypothetical protein